MSHQIKFRAWYKNKKDALPPGMYEVSKIINKIPIGPSWSDIKQVEIFSPIHGPDKNGFALTVTMDEIELMQYTGIHPRDEEWYEGDIIENDGDRYEIVYDSTEARFDAINCFGADDFPLGELHCIGTYKIGNIYENPNLLKHE